MLNGAMTTARTLAAICVTAVVIAIIASGPAYLRWWDAHKAAEQKKWEEFPVVRPAEQ